MPENKKRLEKFDNNWQADVVKNLLTEKNIAYYEIKNSREYAALATGAAQGTVEIYVDASQLSEAQAVLAQYRKATLLHAVADEQSVEENTKSEARSQRKIVLIIAVFLFLLFDILLLLGLIKLN